VSTPEVIKAVIDTAINPALAFLPAHMDSPAARVLLVAIGLQESGLVNRFQLTDTRGGKGPARGLWQNERGGGVRGVCNSSATTEQARLLCHERGVSFDPGAIWARLEYDDVLAAGFARLILWADPLPLPNLFDADAGWLCYLRNWRPGKPRPEPWAGYHMAAVAAVVPPAPKTPPENDL